MKFNEKLIELRKKGGLSQEDLGYQFNVTRQTVSKWELGQTTPEMDKLVEISKFFNVSVDDLINDTEINSNENVVNENVIIEDKNIGEKDNKNRRAIILVIIVIAIVALLGVGIVSPIFKSVNSVFDSVNQQFKAGNEQAQGVLGIFNRILNLMNKQLDEMEENDGNSIGSFNQAIDKINQTQQEIENNKEENDEFFNQVLDGINKTQNEVEIESFNGAFEFYQGTEKGISLKNFIDKVVTNNKTESRKITIIFENQTLTDVDQIRNIKTQIDDFSDYEIDLQYDGNGYICQANIVKL